MIPRPDEHWHRVPDAEPNVTSIAFPAVYRDVHVIATGIARYGQIDLVLAPKVVLQVKIEEWLGFSPYLTAASLMCKPD